MKTLLVLITLIPTISFGQGSLESAKKLMHEKKFKRAESEYTSLIKQSPTFEAFLGRADCFYEQDELQNAIEDYSKALEFNKKN